MMSINSDKYGPAFYCYKTRIYIEPYMVCKHLVCPIEAVTYSCCNFFYNNTIRERVMVCREQVFDFDAMWWVCPSIISFALFAYSPILVMFLFYKAFEKTMCRCPIPQSDCHTHSEYHNQPSLHRNAIDALLMEGHSHVTFLNTICMPFTAIKSLLARSCLRQFLSRFIRVLIPLSTFSIIGLQIFLDYNFLRDFVGACVVSGVPLGFRSMLTGYEASNNNFLPMLGGPFIASTCYFVITIIILVTPKSPIFLLETGLEWQNPSAVESPLCLKLHTIGLLGTVPLENTHRYQKIYSYLLAEFYMLMNTKFWKYVVTLQQNRWESLRHCRLCILLFPIYVIFCVVELFLVILLYGVPIVSFGFIVIKGYCNALIRAGNRIGTLASMCAYVCSICLAVPVFYFLFMFCTIFLDATLFICRVTIFSFTGMLVFPKTAYGYLIFGFTIFYYLWDSLEKFSLIYKKLLKQSIAVASSLQRANDEGQNKVIYKIHGRKWVRESLFEYIIEKHRPRRKQVFLTVLHTGILLGVLWILINLLIKTDTFRELHVIMHVGTALFICALPTLCRRVCLQKDRSSLKKNEIKSIYKTVKLYMGYFEDDHSSGAEETIRSGEREVV
ncbi:hypothetical protein DPMN_005259 [Dreissena polymorpha]|uniref:Uncharacterized protein n=1 Tax=Dreissena polymorpha TaxID=45954 RepID=A0A9D4MT64_DREPO|nr:hypothetical protein DPMN_005259 [Dreissena polymorpha]